MRGKFVLTTLLFLLMACTDETVESVATVTTKVNTNPVVELSKACFAKWEQQQWLLGESQSIAQQNANFRAGINKVCRARAELYAEGYEIYPFISENTQREIYALVFSANVEEIKSHLKVHLPKLRII